MLGLVRTLTFSFRPNGGEAVIRVPVRIFLTSVVLAAASWDAAAQSAVCDTVRPGDTASTVARRLTGRADSRDEPWFRIFDRSRSQVIPTARYDSLLSGWQACVPAVRAARSTPRMPTRAESTPPRRLPQPPTKATASPPPEPTSSTRGAVALACLLLGPAAIGAATGWGWERVEGAVIKRRAIKHEMVTFSRAFVRDFEQPLLTGGAGPPLHARMRCVPRKRRVDILLAPGTGRRYPNLTDHKRNLEYDVCRIANNLGRPAFVPCPPRAEGRWVVIPFYFRPGHKTGAVV